MCKSINNSFTKEQKYKKFKNRTKKFSEKCCREEKK